MRQASSSAGSPGARAANAPRGRSFGPWIVAVLFVALGALCIVHAWISDDAYISFRTIENFVEGRGLVWNPGERVQSYTHPLWVLLLAVPCFFTGEYYLTVIVVSLVLSLAAIWLLVWFSATRWYGEAAALVALGLSVGFVSYTTSGLENPLTYLLLAVFLALLWRPASPRRLLGLGLVGGLAIVDRLDHVLLVGPALAAALAAEKSWTARRPLLAGLAPLVAWALFALVYYGSLLPNSAIAKLYTGIPRSQYLHQGLVYFADALRFEPLTLIGILWGAAAALRHRDRLLLPLGLGVVLHLLYTCWVGGDFMRGRFLAAPFFLCLGILLRTSFLVPDRLLRWVPIVWLGLGIPTLERALLAEPRSHAREDAQLAATGIGDERAYYIDDSGLTRQPLERQVGHDMSLVRSARAKDPARLRLVSVAGRSGFMSDPAVYVIDSFSLTNPLMSRIAVREDRKWRIGHFERVVPEGYLGTLLGTGPGIVDPDVRELYTKVESAARGPLLAPGRWKNILQLNAPWGRKVYAVQQTEVVEPAECVAVAQTHLDVLDLQLLLGAARVEIAAGHQESAKRILRRMLWLLREGRQSLLWRRDYVAELIANVKVRSDRSFGDAEDLLLFTAGELPERREPLLALADLYEQHGRVPEAVALREQAAALPER